MIDTEEGGARGSQNLWISCDAESAAGGGGRGMRIVNSEEELLPQFRSARSEAGKAFGIDDIFIEKYLENPKHIEVQIPWGQRGQYCASVREGLFYPEAASEGD